MGDSHRPETPQPQHDFSGGGAESGAFATADDEFHAAYGMSRKLQAEATAAEKHRSQPSNAKHPAPPPDLSAYAPDGTRRPHPRTLSKPDQLAELTASWSKLTHQESTSLLVALRLCPSIAGRAHVSKLPKVGRPQRMISNAEAAKRLGVTVHTLREWRKRGWITGAERLSNTIHFPVKSVTAAKRAAARRQSRRKKK